MCLENYKLDPAWYYTSLSFLGCSASLNKQRGIRGGIHSMIQKIDIQINNLNKQKYINFFNILTQIIFMVGQCVNHYQQETLKMHFHVFLKFTKNNVELSK